MTVLQTFRHQPFTSDQFSRTCAELGPSLKVFVVLEQNSRGSATTWLDVFDRVLDKGIVVEAWSLGVPLGEPIDMRAGHTRVIVVSIDTYWRLAYGHPSPPHKGRHSTDEDP